MPRNGESMTNSAQTGRTVPNSRLRRTGEAAFKAPSIWKTCSDAAANSAVTPSVISLKCFLVEWATLQEWAGSAGRREPVAGDGQERAEQARKRKQNSRFHWKRCIGALSAS